MMEGFVKRHVNMPALEFHALEEERTDPARLVELLLECKQVLLADGMADMEEYGDMLKWGLPKKDGYGRSIHVFHPDWCSFSDQFKGTIHYHGGEIRGTILIGGMEHLTYEACEDPAGDRFLGDTGYKLTPHTRTQTAGTTYRLPAMVPHWIKPTALTLTHFEEEDNERMGDLLNPAGEETDEHTWTQAQADALLPELLKLIDARIAQLQLTA